MRGWSWIRLVEVYITNTMKPWVPSLALYKRVRLYAPVTPALRRQRQEEQEFKVTLCHKETLRPAWATVSPYLKTNKQQTSGEPERWLVVKSTCTLRGSEFGFSVSSTQLTITSNSALGDLMPSSGLLRHCAHIYTYTYSYTHKTAKQNLKTFPVKMYLK